MISVNKTDFMKLYNVSMAEDLQKAAQIGVDMAIDAFNNQVIEPGTKLKARVGYEPGSEEGKGKFNFLLEID